MIFLYLLISCLLAGSNTHTHTHTGTTIWLCHSFVGRGRVRKRRGGGEDSSLGGGVGPVKSCVASWLIYNLLRLNTFCLPPDYTDRWIYRQAICIRICICICSIYTLRATSLPPVLAFPCRFIHRMSHDDRRQFEKLFPIFCLCFQYFFFSIRY